MPDPNDVASKLAAAKAALAHAKTIGPSMATSSGSMGGHDAGVAFAQSHSADPQGSTITGTLNQAVSDSSGLKARMKAIHDLNPQ